MRRGLRRTYTAFLYGTDQLDVVCVDEVSKPIEVRLEPAEILRPSVLKPHSLL